MLWCASSKTVRWDSHVALGLIDIFLLPEHYSPSSLTLAFLITDAHSVLSKDLVLHICTSIFLKSNSVSSSHLRLALHFFTLLLVYLPVHSLLSFMVFRSMHHLLKLKKIPTNALYYTIKFLQLKQVFTIKSLTCFDPLWVILRECTSVFL